MPEYVKAALLVYTQETQEILDELQNNPQGVEITPVLFSDLESKPQKILEHVEHVVVAGELDIIKPVLRLAMEYHFSIGLLPPPAAKNINKYLSLPTEIDEAIDLALSKDPQEMDIILCNQEILLFKATIGRLPIIDSHENISVLRRILDAIRKSIKIESFSFNFTLDNQKKINTVACGCMIVQYHKGSLAAKIVSHNGSYSDGMTSVLISSPLSRVDYVKFLIQSIKATLPPSSPPKTTGYIRSSQIDISCEKELAVHIDGEAVTQTPLHCETVPRAVKINIGDKDHNKKEEKPIKEEVRIENLPIGKELLRAKGRKIPVLPYASEERFKDLFIALREDAKINSAYVVLMFLSTILATVGLYMNSGSVIIGAMLLAPLMAPIIALAMGVLRQDEPLIKRSVKKIIVGLFIALATSAFITWTLSYKPITAEMEGRLHPTLLDLSVAIVAGIAGAYTKSFREILQSLAGVAIAVALVPPLAVAGIGIGRFDLDFFAESFLLFATNLIGIVLAATFTFKLLGYSAAIRNKKIVGVIVLLMALITVPLYYSYYSIANKNYIEQRWQQERFLINGKYLIVENAQVQSRFDKNIIVMEIITREPLSRQDLALLKKKIQTNFNNKIVVRIKLIYIP